MWHNPFSPRGEGANRRMRGSCQGHEAREFKATSPLIRPFGPPSPQGEKELLVHNQPLNVYSAIDSGFISIEKPGKLGGM